MFIRSLSRAGKQIMLARENGGLLTALRIVASKLGDLKFHNRAHIHYLASPASVGPLNELLTDKKIRFFIHIFYAEYIEPTIALVHLYGVNCEFYISCGSSAIQNQIQHHLSNLNFRGRVVVSENKGRNFGPLFVEFSQEIKEAEIAIHLHSKISPQYARRVSSTWSNNSWKILGLEPSLFGACLAHFQRNPNVGLAFSVSTKITPRSSFNWGLNYSQGRKFLNSLGLSGESLEQRVFYPAGGMFMFRPKAISPLTDRSWSYSEFPTELGQLDATLAHVIERSIGHLAQRNGFEVLVFDEERGKFTLNFASSISAKAGAS